MAEFPDVDAWSRFEYVGPEDVDPRRTVILERNGWKALVAFAAGPERCRLVPVQADPPVRVTTSRLRGGALVESTHEEPFSDADDAIVHTDMADYLADAGVPAPPRGVRWVLDLPPGVSEDEFWAALDEAVEAAVDTSSAALRSTSPGPTPRVPVLEAARSALTRLYGPPD